MELGRRQFLKGAGALVVVTGAVGLKGCYPVPEPATSVSDLTLIKQFEGLKLIAYKPFPNDKWTIGYGHTQGVHAGMRITQKQANEFLMLDIEWVEEAINRNVTVTLTQNQYDALASWVFNLGETNLRKSTLLHKLNSGDYKGAGEEFLRWNKQDGETVNGLIRRREAELALWKRK